MKLRTVAELNNSYTPEFNGAVFINSRSLSKRQRKFLNNARPALQNLVRNKDYNMYLNIDGEWNVGSIALAKQANSLMSGKYSKPNIVVKQNINTDTYVSNAKTAIREYEAVGDNSTRNSFWNKIKSIFK